MLFPSRGLYAITQTDGQTPEAVLKAVDAGLRGGVKVVQYRDKNPVDPRYLAPALVDLCHRYGVPLLINDDVELAHESGADGVHLGRDDGSLAAARQLLGESAIIGRSCYNSIELALEAQAQGATYVAFGRFFPSSSKPLASPAELSTLRQARDMLTIPIVAIGGILPSNGAQLLDAGADLLAVIGGIFDGEPEASARAFQTLFDRS